MAILSGKKKNLAALMGQMNKKFGDGTVNFMGEVKEALSIKRIKTPSNELNIMLGGGLCGGKIIECYGENSSGKTSLLINTIAYNQSINENFTAGWFETEQSIDPDQLQSMGVDMDRLVYWDQTQVGAEQGFDILRGLVDSGEFDMIIVNSIAGLCPSKEQEDDIEKSNIALTARLLSKLFRVITASASKNKTTLAFVNQTRTNVGQMFGDPTVTPGGKSLAFYASQRIAMRRVKINAGEPITADDGVKVACRTVKNRYAIGNPFKACEYYAIYGQGIDTISEMPDILHREGIVEKSGSWFAWKDKTGAIRNIDGMECKFRSKAVFTDALRSNPALKDMLEKEIDKLFASTKAGVDISQEEVEQIKIAEQKLELELGKINK